eukprot:scaffold770_cov255-Pinguiococcus_pyrenoidosus.AAC.16
MASPRPIKLAFVGPCGAGKSSLIRRLTHLGFPEAYVPTLGSETTFVDVAINERLGLSLEILDVGGSLSTASAPALLLRHCKAVVYVVDAGSHASLQQLRAWRECVDALVPGESPRLLLVNKADRLLLPSAITAKALDELEAQMGLFRWAFTVGDTQFGDYVAERRLQRRQSTVAKELKRLVDFLHTQSKKAEAEVDPPRLPRPVLGRRSLAKMLSVSREEQERAEACARQLRTRVEKDAEAWRWTVQARQCRERAQAVPLPPEEGLLQLDPAWRFYAGWIGQQRAASILLSTASGKPRPFGSFVLHSESAYELILSILVEGEERREVRHGLLTILNGEIWDADRTNGPFETLSGFIAALRQNLGFPLTGVVFRLTRPIDVKSSQDTEPYEVYASTGASPDDANS